MNAHNEQHDRASAVVKQNLTTQPAAAQEAVAEPIYQLRKADGSWVDQAKHSYDYNMAQGHKADLRVVYAAPVTAAPADHLHAHLLHMLGAKDHEDAGRIIGELHAAAMRTTAAPGIDLVSDILTDLSNVAASWVVEAAGTAADAQNECAMQMHEAIERWSNKLQLGDASPKGGSEARDAELKAAQDAGHTGAIRWVLGHLNGHGECGGTYYEEILNWCGREQIIQSAIDNDELEFTGLADFIKKCGTPAEKRKVRARRHSKAQAGDAEVQP